MQTAKNKMMLTENDKKDSVGQADLQWRTGQPEVFKKTIGKMKENRPNYMKDYMREWNRNHPNYRRDHLKEWKGNVKRINAGSTLKVEGVDLAVVSEPEKSVFREIDETMRKESTSKQDGW